MVRQTETLARAEPLLRFISLGGGVQSTVLALMADEGAFGEIPDVAIFADTYWEPSGVYENVEWLSSVLSFPVVTTSNGRSLRDDAHEGVSDKGRPATAMPLFTVSQEGSGGMLPRQCTDHYKIRPIHHAVKRLLRVDPARRMPAGISVETWLGISAEEVLRMRDSHVGWNVNRYPLVERGMTRYDCLEWFAERYSDRPLARSACAGCPFRSDEEWISLKTSDPDLFEDAVELDRRLRDGDAPTASTIEHVAFLHRSHKPLDEAVERAEHLKKLQPRLWVDECQGVCGV